MEEIATRSPHAMSASVHPMGVKGDEVDVLYRCRLMAHTWSMAWAS